MRKQTVLFTLVFVGATIGAGCAAAPQASTTTTTNTATSVVNNGALVTSSHSTGASSSAATNQSVAAPGATGGAASAGAPHSGSSAPGGGMGRAVDLTEPNAEIAKAEKAFQQKPTDAAAKKALAEAYLVRANALTGAAQYRSALGDYRRVLKLDADNKDAHAAHNQIINIFQSLNREPPKEGEEPPPMPFNKKV